MSVNIKDIAKSLNVSPSTVSRVINGKGNISEETKKRVLSAIDELNYVPNKVARNLKNSETKTIGVIVPDISESFFAFVIKGIDDVLSKNGYSIFLCDSDENPEKEEHYVNLLFENQVDGIIIATIRNSFKSDDKLLNGNMPTIFIDNIPNTKFNYDSVTIDNVKASYLAVEHLIENGHTRIAGIMGKQNETTGYDRYAGYCKALKDRHIDKKIVKFGDFKEKSGYEAMKELIESGEEFTSVFISSCKMTYGAIMAIKEKGLKIPEDIAIVGFDIHDEYNLLKPGLTTIIQPEMKIGSAAADFVLKKILKEEGYNQRLLIDPKLIVRESSKFTK